MSIKEFWEEDPELFWAYRFAFFNHQKQEQELKNYNAWIQGMYFCEAVSVSLANAFSKTPMNYPEKPYDLTKQDEETKKQNAVIKLKNRVAAVQGLWKEKEKGVVQEEKRERK